MQTTTLYRRLSSTEREEVSRSLAQGIGLSAIARRLGRAPSTVARVKHWGHCLTLQPNRSLGVRKDVFNNQF